MLFYETKINKKLKKLPEDIKKEVLDFVDFLTNKYSFDVEEKKHKKKSNPFRKLAGFVSINNSTSKDIDKEVYNL